MAHDARWWFERLRAMSVAENASADGFAPARHLRTLIRAGDSLAVVDEIRDARDPAPVIARWHLAPALVTVDIADGFVTIRDPAGGGPDRWLWFGCSDGSLQARAIGGGA